MLELCANLSAERISSVRRNVDELRRYVFPPVDQVERARRPENDTFCQLLGDEMLHIERAEMQPVLRRIVEGKLLPGMEKRDIVFPDHIDRGRYQGRVCLMRKQIQLLEDRDMRLHLTRCIDHLSVSVEWMGWFALE